MCGFAAARAATTVGNAGCYGSNRWFDTLVLYSTSHVLRFPHPHRALSSQHFLPVGSLYFFGGSVLAGCMMDVIEVMDDP